MLNGVLVLDSGTYRPCDLHVGEEGFSVSHTSAAATANLWPTRFSVRNDDIKAISVRAFVQHLSLNMNPIPDFYRYELVFNYRTDKKESHWWKASDSGQKSFFLSSPQFEYLRSLLISVPALSNRIQFPP